MSGKKPENPTKESQKVRARFLRGGNSYDYPYELESSYRYSGPPSNRDYGNGLRIARTVKK